MTIAIDFDDTIMDTQKVRPGYRMGTPITGAIASVQRLHMEGHTIIIFTARDVRLPAAHKAVADWLDYFKIPYHGITNVKQPSFDVMVDNRALHFDSWPQTLHRLTALQNAV